MTTTTDDKAPEVECRFCGRRYDDLTQVELSRMTRSGPCPSDDCPGHEPAADPHALTHPSTRDDDFYGDSPDY